MKILIFPFMFVVLALVVSAVEVNDTLTQTQVNNIDTDLTPGQFRSTYQCQLHNNGGVAQRSNIWYFFKRFSCLSLTDDYDNRTNGEYLVIREHFTPNLRVSRIMVCLTLFSRAECRDQVDGNFRGQAIVNMNSIQDTIRYFQTDGSSQDLRDFNGGLW